MEYLLLQYFNNLIQVGFIQNLYRKGLKKNQLIIHTRGGEEGPRMWINGGGGGGGARRGPPSGGPFGGERKAGPKG